MRIKFSFSILCTTIISMQTLLINGNQYFSNVNISYDIYKYEKMHLLWLNQSIIVNKYKNHLSILHVEWKDLIDLALISSSWIYSSNTTDIWCIYGRDYWDLLFHWNALFTEDSLTISKFQRTLTPKDCVEFISKCIKILLWIRINIKTISPDNCWYTASLRPHMHCIRSLTRPRIYDRIRSNTDRISS
jgi:hypothetical protein